MNTEHDLKCEKKMKGADFCSCGIRRIQKRCFDTMFQDEARKQGMKPIFVPVPVEITTMPAVKVCPIPDMREFHRTMDTINYAIDRMKMAGMEHPKEMTIYLGSREDRALTHAFWDMPCKVSDPTVTTREYKGLRVVIVNELSHIGFGHSSF